MVALAISVKGTVAESNLTHNDVIAQKTLGQVVVGADLRIVETGHQFVDSAG